MNYKQTCCHECGHIKKTKIPTGLPFNGKTQSARAWSKELGISHTTIGRRLSSGMTIKQALTAPKGTHNGNEQ